RRCRRAVLARHENTPNGGYTSSSAKPATTIHRWRPTEFEANAAVSPRPKAISSVAVALIYLTQRFRNPNSQALNSPLPALPGVPPAPCRRQRDRQVRSRHVATLLLRSCVPVPAATDPP